VSGVILSTSLTEMEAIIVFGVNPFDQTSVQVKLCYSESGVLATCGIRRLGEAFENTTFHR